MSKQKQRIRNSFNKAASTYDKYSFVQERVGQTLVANILKYQSYFPSIIDLGCGTAKTTQCLALACDFERLIAVDISDRLLKLAKERLSDPRINCVENDFDHLLLDASFDCIFSNMSLQWSTELEFTLGRMRNMLNKNGLFAFTLPLLGTFDELPSSTSNSFHSEETIQKLLLENHFEILEHSSQRCCLHFKTPLSALKYIKHIGANCLFSPSLKTLASKTHFANIIKSVKTANNNTILSYNIGFFIGRKSCET